MGMTTKQRALGVIRISKLTDETTSPERQRELITRAAELKDAEIIGWAEDLDVSASKTHPMQRPSLQEWFERTDDFDMILFWRTDRFVRKVSDLADMIAWCRTNGKSLASATEAFDLSSPFGEAMAYMIAIFAQMEAANMRERVMSSHDYLRRNGRWGGGKPPYGYKQVPNPNGAGYVLTLDDADDVPNTPVKIIREAVRRVIAGESLNAIAASFSERGIIKPTGRAGRWDSSSLAHILRSEALLGRVLHKGKNLPGQDGMPITRAEPIIDASDWTQLQAALETLSKTKTRTQTPSLLLNVAYCGKCGAPLYKWSTVNKQRKTYYYYRCKNTLRKHERETPCDASIMSCENLDGFVNERLVESFGNVQRTVKRIKPGSTHTAELTAVGRQIADLTEERFVKRIQRPDFHDMMQRLEAEHTRLSALPSEPDRVVYEPTGQTIGAWWATLTDTDKLVFLRSCGVRVEMTAKPVQTVSIHWGELERMAEQTGASADELAASWAPGDLAHLVSADHATVTQALGVTDEEIADMP